MWCRLARDLKASLDLLLPPACLLCGHPLQTGRRTAFCDPCLAGMTPLGTAHCRRCAQPFPDAASCHVCGTCLKRPPGFSRVHAAGIYQGSIKEALQRLKYRNQLILAKPLGRLLGKTLADSFVAWPDCIIPVPLHPRRLRQRGYNQAHELARPLSRDFGCPIEAGLLQRHRRTPPQQGLSAMDRGRNLRNAFELSSPIGSARVLLVDDIMTTGETVRECCRTLLRGGAAEIQVAVVGRA